ncbi:MAG: hypothetical protein K2M12_01245 [Muribaculaceae bacterium]|nr:hypothetical protein [Muribaculaceae bacterium]
MRHYFEKKHELEQGINEFSRTRAGRRLKCAAFIAAALCVALLLAQIIFLADMPARTLLFLRGCAGLCAIVFVILVAILTFRANTATIQPRSRWRDSGRQ